MAEPGYHFSMTNRATMSAKPEITNKHDASSKNNLVLADRPGVFLMPINSRMTSRIPATANSVGQSGLRWLTVSPIIQLASLRGLKARRCGGAGWKECGKTRARQALNPPGFYHHFQLQIPAGLRPFADTPPGTTRHQLLGEDCRCRRCDC